MSCAIAYRRACRLSRSGLFKKSLCSPRCMPCKCTRVPLSQKTTAPLESPKVPRRRATIESYGGAFHISEVPLYLVRYGWFPFHVFQEQRGVRCQSTRFLQLCRTSCGPLGPLGSSSSQRRRTPKIVLQKGHTSFRSFRF